MIRMRAFILCLSLFSIFGCTTPYMSRFDKVNLGMDKTDVIDELGSPNRSYHADEEDVWLYSIHTETSVEQREISFKDGFVSYIGEPQSRAKTSNVKSEEQAAAVLEKALKKDKKSPDYKDIKDDGSF